MNLTLAIFHGAGIPKDEDRALKMCMDGRFDRATKKFDQDQKSGKLAAVDMKMGNGETVKGLAHWNEENQTFWKS